MMTYKTRFNNFFINVIAQGHIHQDRLPAPTMWMTMRAINNHVLNLKSMVHIIPNAMMATNKDITNILNKLKSNRTKRHINLKANHTMVHHLWRTKTNTKRTNLLKTKHNMVSHLW
jgi:hypothetical protein